MLSYTHTYVRTYVHDQLFTYEASEDQFEADVVLDSISVVVFLKNLPGGAWFF